MPEAGRTREHICLVRRHQIGERLHFLAITIEEAQMKYVVVRSCHPEMCHSLLDALLDELSL